MILLLAQSTSLLLCVFVFVLSSPSKALVSLLVANAMSPFSSTSLSTVATLVTSDREVSLVECIPNTHKCVFILYDYILHA